MGPNSAKAAMPLKFLGNRTSIQRHLFPVVSTLYLNLCACNILRHLYFRTPDVTMEHLGLPAHSERIAITVPCLSAEIYDGGPTASYLERVNLTENHILSPQERGLSLELAITHLQAWLFFGTLGELATITQYPIATDPPLPQLFVCSSDENAQVISTKHLRSFWSQIELELNSASNDEQDRYRYKIITVLEQSNLLISKLGEAKLNPSHQAVVLSIILLNEFIMDAADLREMEDTRPVFRSLLLESVMQEKEWCPSDIERLRLDLDISSLFFTASLGAPPCRKSHENCTRMICNARQILDIEEYLPKHVASTSCDCEYMSVDHAIMLESLDSEIIPVTRFDSRSHPPTLETLKSNQIPRYVAISHVWSDRMGNRSANALPPCLLKYLQDCVDNLYMPSDTPTSFWIDTLSCPVEPESATDQAIALMRETYADAEKVLVIDSYLEMMESKGMTDFEQALRIICTGWTRRLWTLQEGILGKSIYFQFADAAINGDDLFMRLSKPPIAYKTIPIIHSWWEIRHSWKDHSTIGNEFVWMLYRALRFRTTSVSTDEPLCLSALTSVDLKEILKEKKENRMKRFWELMPQISTALFYWDGPRLKDRGFRWAPASLLCATPEAFLASSPKQIREAKEATLSKSGLIVTSPGIRLGKWKTAIRKGFCLNCEDVWYYVNLVRDVGLPISLSSNIDMVEQLESWDPPVLTLLTHTSLEECFDDPNFQYLELPPSCSLISIYGATSDMLFASFESVGIIRRLSSGQIPPLLGIPVPALAGAAEPELSASADTLQGAPGASESMSVEENNPHDLLVEDSPSVGERATSIDDTENLVLLDEDRLSLVVSGSHTMFHGALIPPTQRFCLG
jgi:hypothetical protein